MNVYMQTFLPGCAAPWPDDFTEHSSLKAAKSFFLCEAEDIDRLEDGKEAEAIVFFGVPTGMYPCDTYPDRQLSIGPRWGLQCARC